MSQFLKGLHKTSEVAGHKSAIKGKNNQPNKNQTQQTPKRKTNPWKWAGQTGRIKKLTENKKTFIAWKLWLREWPGGGSHGLSLPAHPAPAQEISCLLHRAACTWPDRAALQRPPARAWPPEQARVLPSWPGAKEIHHQSQHVLLGCHEVTWLHYKRYLTRAVWLIACWLIGRYSLLSYLTKPELFILYSRSAPAATQCSQSRGKWWWLSQCCRASLALE